MLLSWWSLLGRLYLLGLEVSRVVLDTMESSGFEREVASTDRLFAFQ